MNQSGKFASGNALPWLLIALISALVYFLGSAISNDWLMWIGKPIPVLCLIVLLRVWSPVPDFYRRAIAVGFVFSLAGDVFLMLPRDLFIFGLGSFLLAHLCYIAAFSNRGASGKVSLQSIRLIPFLAYGMGMLGFLWPNLGELRLPVIVYVGVILTMGWRAAARIGHPGESPKAHWSALCGAISFILSDTLIALEKFHGAFPFARFLIMLTYWAGQLGIALSVRRAPMTGKEDKIESE